MSNPFFSVIVPAYNAEQFMRKGLDAIRGQDFTDYELIVVCDSCTDGTEQIAEEYADTLLTVGFGRAGMSRNAGINIATGKWILFADDDDWYLPGAFRAIHDALKDDPPVDLLAYGFVWKGKGPCIQNNGRIYTAVWNKAWRREFIGSERFPDWIHTDDLGFARKMHPKARWGYLPMILYYYNFLRPGSVSDKIKNGEYDSSKFPDEFRDAAIRYEQFLRKG